MPLNKRPDNAYIVMRESTDPNKGDEQMPIAICVHLEDADNMKDQFNQEMKDREIGTINFYVITTAFYD